MREIPLKILQKVTALNGFLLTKNGSIKNEVRKSILGRFIKTKIDGNGTAFQHSALRQ